jgi:hypothetical protein
MDLSIKIRKTRVIYKQKRSFIPLNILEEFINEAADYFSDGNMKPTSRLPLKAFQTRLSLLDLVPSANARRNSVHSFIPHGFQVLSFGIR